MAVRSKRLYAGSPTGGVLTTLYTAPAGYRAIVKTIMCKSAQGAAQNQVFQIVTAGGTGAPFSLYTAATGTNGDTINYQCWLVLMPGDQLKVTLGTASGWLSVHGAELAE